MNDGVVSNEHCREIYKKLCRGDRQASNELVTLFGDRLYQFIRRNHIYHSREEAEDCIQNTWIKLLQYCGKPLKKSNFWGFLCSIARNQSIDDYRARTRQKRSPEEVVEYNDNYSSAAYQDDKADPVNVLTYLEAYQEAEDRLQRFQSELSTLPKKQKLALILQLQGYSLKEIAHHMGEKNETVKSHLRYAKKKIKQALLP